MSHYESSLRGTWRGGSFTGDPERYKEESFGSVSLSVGALLGILNGWGGGLFTGDFERQTKDGSGNGQLSP